MSVQKMFLFNFTAKLRTCVARKDGEVKGTVKKGETRTHPLKLKGDLRERERARDRKREEEKPTSPLAQ